MHAYAERTHRPEHAKPQRSVLNRTHTFERQKTLDRFPPRSRFNLDMSGIPQKAEPAPWWSKAPPRAPTVRETPDPQTVVFENGATAIRFPRGWKPTVEDFTATSDLPRSWTPLAHEESENFVRAVEMGFQFPVAQSYLNLDGDLRAISLKPDATYEEIVRRLATIEKTLQGRFVVRDPLGLNLLQDACKRLQKNLMLPMGNGRYVPHAPVTRLYVPVRFPQGLRAYLARHFPGRTVTDFLKGQALKDFQREGEAALGPDRVFHQRLEIFGAPIEGNTALSRRVAIRMEFHDFPKERKELIETKPFHEIRWALINGFIPGYEQGSGAAPETAKRVSAQEVWQINQGRAAFAALISAAWPAGCLIW